jgi:AcrR family transcriptional regulator
MEPSPRMTRGDEARPPAASSRRVLEASLEVFGEDGYDAATTSDAGLLAIARRAGVTLPGLYEIFGDRSGLYRATVALAAERFVQIVTAARHDAAFGEDSHASTRIFLHRLLGGIRQQPAMWGALTDRPRDAWAAAQLSGVQAEMRAAIIGGAMATRSLGRTPHHGREPEWAARFIYGGLAEVLRQHLREAPATDDLALVEFLADVTNSGRSRRASTPSGTP